jgi:CBS-domain-containing membrane protein
LRAHAQALHSRRISAVPLVDATTGAFMDQFGVADIRAVANLHGDDLASALDMDVFTLLARLSLAEASHGVSHAERTLTMSASDTFGKAVEALAATGAHRVFILGEGRRPVGVVSASDVLRVALGVRATA